MFPSLSIPTRARYKRIVIPPAPQPGSTLRSLAQIHYGDAGQWHRIFDANRYGVTRADGSAGLLQNPNLLPVGVTLIIPR